MSSHDDVEAGRRRWQQRYDEALAKGRVRDADFTTLSGSEVQPVYGPPPGVDDPRMDRIGWPGSTPSPAGSTRRATAVAPGPSGSSRASAAPSRPTSATG
ncbi:hypothetical protein GCM10025868_39230 [Angustibacter aerolatus]|uniref:Methylmalonyl-CoA mutase domain-containing protein n=1 Tax=Angustibacter aerolatus TaxID=1162965 RepID=A0ABQ6JKZ9_9ACTN|nr:hypothetical protein GCM10025868_39230 [Angustibacter aerolatus]